MPRNKKITLTAFHFHEALDRTSVLLHHGEIVGSHPAIQQDPVAAKLWSEIETKTIALYSHLGKAQLERYVESRIAYMDRVDFSHHLGEGNDPDPVKVYASPEDAVRLAGHDLNECGIVQVEVVPLKSVRIPKLRSKRKKK